MSDDNPIIQVNLDQFLGTVRKKRLLKSTTAFLEKVADALIILAELGQMERIAKDRVKVGRPKMVSGWLRLNCGEMPNRHAIEMLLSYTIPHISDSADPAQMDTDWIVYFFNKICEARYQNSQNFWAGVLAGEANRAGSFSRRMLDAMVTLDECDVELFKEIYAYCWVIRNMESKIIETVLMAKNNYPIENREHIFSASNISQLQASGLIAHTSDSGGILNDIPEQVILDYHGKKIKVDSSQCKAPDNTRLNLGSLALTHAGTGLLSLWDAEGHESRQNYFNKKEYPDYFDAVVLSLVYEGRKVSVPH